MKRLFGILLFCFLFSLSFGTEYYVKNGGDDGKDGLSDANAWATISKVQSTLNGDQSDDTVYFKCGSTWAEVYTIAGYGTSGHPFVHESYDTGSKPCIDGGLTRSKNIYADTKNYVTIDGLDVKNPSDSHNIVFIDSTGIVVKNCDITNPQGDGVRLYGCSSCTIEDNSFDTTTDSNAYQNDCIYMEGGSGGHIIQRNTFLQRKSGGQYIDAIQGDNVDNVTIRFNLITCTTNTTTAGQIFMLENMGTCNIYYNVIINSSPHASGVGAVKCFTSGTYNIYNNTIVCSGINRCVASDLNSGVTVKNNAFYSYNETCVNFTAGISTPSNLNYNCYYRETGGSDIGTDDGGDKTWAEWQSAGYEANGINLDPLFIDSSNDNYKIKHGSPCRGAGVDVSLTQDYDGKPIHHAPDIGAYETDYNAPLIGVFFILLLISIRKWRK